MHLQQEMRLELTMYAGLEFDKLDQQALSWILLLPGTEIVRALLAIKYFLQSFVLLDSKS